MAYAAQKCGSNDALIDEMIKNKSITCLKAASVMKKVDRKHFVLSKDEADAYDDRPIPIGHGATISAPHMHAAALEYLMDNLNPGSIVLDVGSGSGYLCACLAHFVIGNNNNNNNNNENNNNNNKNENKNGKVIGIEHIKELAEQSIKNLSKSKIHKQFLKDKIIEIKIGDARKEIPNLLFDAIHVGAAAAPEVASFLATKLKIGGKMVIPVDSDKGDCQLFTLVEKRLKKSQSNDKNDNNNNSERKQDDGSDYEIVSKILQYVRYVPLTSETNQRGMHEIRMQYAKQQQQQQEQQHAAIKMK